MRKLLPSLLLLLPSLLLAQPELRVSTAWGLTTGRTYELVYRSPTTSAYTSELIWPTPLSVAGSVEARWDWGSFSSRVGFGINFPLDAGIMTDDDFSISAGGTLLYDVHSSTPAFVLTDSAFWAEQLWSLRLASGRLSPLVGFKLRTLAWESWTDPEGSLQVWTPVDGSEAQAFALYGLVITFRQQRLVPYLGFEAEGSGQKRRVTLGLRASPWLIALDTDFHVPSTVYFDATAGGFELEPRLEIAFPWTDRIEVGLRTSLTWAALLRGTTTAVAARAQDSGVNYVNQAGTGWQSLNWEVFLKN